jgi:hypothetical protein
VSPRYPMVRTPKEISRFETGLARVPGAVAASAAAPMRTTSRNSSHRPNPGGTRILRLPCALHAYSRAAIGMDSRMKMCRRIPGPQWDPGQQEGERPGRMAGQPAPAAAPRPRAPGLGDSGTAARAPRIAAQSWPAPPY